MRTIRGNHWISVTMLGCLALLLQVSEPRIATAQPAASEQTRHTGALEDAAGVGSSGKPAPASTNKDPADGSATARPADRGHASTAGGAPGAVPLDGGVRAPHAAQLDDVGLTFLVIAVVIYLAGMVVTEHLKAGTVDATGRLLERDHGPIVVDAGMTSEERGSAQDSGSSTRDDGKSRGGRS